MENDEERAKEFTGCFTRCKKISLVDRRKLKLVFIAHGHLRALILYTTTVQAISETFETHPSNIMIISTLRSVGCMNKIPVRVLNIVDDTWLKPKSSFRKLYLLDIIRYTVKEYDIDLQETIDKYRNSVYTNFDKNGVYSSLEQFNLL